MNTNNVCFSGEVWKIIPKLSPNIYILNVFAEKPYSKAVERNDVYVSIIISSHATSHDGK